jgi:hypothetical protein
MSMMSKESIELDHEEDGQVGAFGVDDKAVEIEYKRVIEYFLNKYESSEGRCDAHYKHPDCLPITGNEEAISVVTPWGY